MRISVIIPAFNACHYLEKAVNSVFATQYIDLEVLIVDDKSKDGTLQLAKNLAYKRPDNIRVLQTPGKANRGAGAARNMGINHAAGELIAFLDADDVYLSNRFDKDVEILKNNKDIDGVYGAWDLLYQDKKRRREWEELIGKQRKFISIQDPNRVLKILKQTGGLWHTNTITLRKCIIEKAEGFNESLRLHQDIELWTRIALVGNIVSGEIETPVSVYRRHGYNRFDPKDRMNLYRNTRINIELMRWAMRNKKSIHPIRFTDLQDIVENSVINCLIKMRARKMPWQGLMVAINAIMNVKGILGKKSFISNLAYLLSGK